eukprot:TRINITY_DN62857_c0_g1_i1.p1 TRINITY_DN62857_c0_g1~~TRINITY_DN62857_c0_g1_i1.p1  ORF type:complete len:240 (-),score=33.24 TRINITY_DN62857_c0_g1_i1:38-757(-)
MSSQVSSRKKWLTTEKAALKKAVRTQEATGSNVDWKAIATALNLLHGNGRTDIACRDQYSEICSGGRGTLASMMATLNSGAAALPYTGTTHKAGEEEEEDDDAKEARLQQDLDALRKKKREATEKERREQAVLAEKAQWKKNMEASLQLVKEDLNDTKWLIGELEAHTSNLSKQINWLVSFVQGRAVCVPPPMQPTMPVAIRGAVPTPSPDHKKVKIEPRSPVAPRQLFQGSKKDPMVL